MPSYNPVPIPKQLIKIKNGKYFKILIDIFFLVNMFTEAEVMPIA